MSTNITTMEDQWVQNAIAACVQKAQLPSTTMQATGTLANMSKIANIKTHDIVNGVVDSRKLFYLFRFFTFTSSTVESFEVVVKANTGLGKDYNCIVAKEYPTRSSITLAYESDTDNSVSLFVSTEVYQQVYCQMLYGDESCVTFYYNAPFNVTGLASPISQVYDSLTNTQNFYIAYNENSIAPMKLSRDIGSTKKTSCMFVSSTGALTITGTKTDDKSNLDHENKIVLNETDIILYTPIGKAFYPANDVSTRLGTSTNRWDTTYVKRLDVYSGSDNVSTVRVSRDISTNKKTANMFINSAGNLVITCAFLDSTTVFDNSSKIEVTEGNTYIYSPTGSGVVFGGDFAQFPVRSSAPANPQNGYTYFNSTSKKLLTYYSGSWYSNGVVS